MMPTDWPDWVYDLMEFGLLFLLCAPIALLYFIGVTVSLWAR